MMPALLETICCQDGHLLGLPFHQKRVRRSARALGISPYPILQHLKVPEFAQNGRFKCRLVYRDRIEKMEFKPYTIRPVRRLKLVKADHIDYACKYEDRTLINTAFRNRGRADDVLLVKQGLLTDTSYANIALWDGQRWLTPEVPLLEGTRRAQLLEQGRIFPSSIRAADLCQFEKIALFNAMMGLEEGPVITLHPSNIQGTQPFTKR